MKIIFVVVSLFAVAFAAPQSSIGFSGGRIVGGSNAEQNEFPHQCSLQRGIIFKQHFCGCSILNSKWILTAAHCIISGSIDVVAGKLNLAKQEPSQQRISVSKSFVHSGYGGGVGPDDIALLRLSAPLVFSEAIQPVTLPEKDSIPDGSTFLSGWGSMSTTNSPVYPDILQKVALPIVPFDECLEALPSGAPLEKSNVCTGPLTSGFSACSGDSGGPLVQVTDGVTTQIGIVSWGMFPCGHANGPSVYGRVSHYIDWIQEVQESNN